ncbi:trace amine-associated receptor 13c-like [Erpetoichthys calabaricus]|uniref:trace amine-associated receptor 13c-like n=1 Tax=Erpetoichthys calabaricus TaxID=27687 RepID=UPI002234D207|nr:trace amine-associated receptor 13c-like [Erpetoichthys calabaricus]
MKEIRTKYASVILYIFGTAAVMLTFCGNLVVIISISHFKQLHTPTNILVLSLAVADFLVGIIIMPFMLIQSIETCWYFGETVCYIYTCFLTTLTTVSVFNLVLIAIDRYFAVCDPLLYSTRITVHITCIAILIIWLLTFFYACAEVFSGGSIEGNLELDPCPGDCLLMLNSTWSIVDPICGFSVPVSIMTVLYTKIFIVAKRHANAISTQQKSLEISKKGNKSKKSEQKAAKTLGIVMAVFLFCLSPVYIFMIVTLFTNVSVPSALSCALLWLVYLNSCMNPIMYALFYPWFQKSFKLMITLQIWQNGSSSINLFPQH